MRFAPVLWLLLLSVYGGVSGCNTSAGEPTEFVEYGWIEPVAITGSNIVLNAKLDTGADQCSLHAFDMEVYRKNKRNRVKFNIRTRQGEEHHFDLPVVRFASIKRIEGHKHVRPVVRMYICLGGQYMNVDVNLVNRENFAYPMLIGRNFLQGNGMVNPAKSFTSIPQCSIDGFAKKKK